ncbi:DUF5776 domain-containing protein [Levilactobacillus lanxiensis]|uniref:DUF5776 domain-containing protein n=1 Tax=Levilactobacillus lanxiensis TaxID=2799568 RepID=A0ABW4CZ45_9LACO|nr:DUF5776 domain-containing protein [Levilactobacillus lanxiensis]
MKIQRKIVRALVMMGLVLVSVGGISLTANSTVMAATTDAMATVTPVDSGTTIDNALPDSDTNAKIVKDAILTAGTNYGKPLTKDSTLADVANAKLTVTISDKLTKYASLLKVEKYFNGLLLNDQDNLSKIDVTTITTALLTDNATGPELEALGFSNDSINEDGLDNILKTVSGIDSTSAIKYLILNRNPLNDFTAWTVFKNKTTNPGNAEKIQALNANELKLDGKGKTLDPVAVKDSTIKVPYSAFTEYSHASDSLAGCALAIRYYQGIPDYFDGHNEETSDSSETLFGELYPQNIAEYSLGTVEFSDVKLDLSEINVLDTDQIAKGDQYQVQGPKYYIRAPKDLYESMLSAIESSPDMIFTVPVPGGGTTTSDKLPDNFLDNDTLVINVPAGAKKVQVRIAVTDANNKATYTQIYTIPIAGMTDATDTNTSGSNSASANSSSESSVTSESSSATTNQSTSKRPTVIYATKKIGLYRTPNFSTKTRQAWYAKQPRIYRPMFEVTGYAQSTKGTPRYLVKDVNHESKTYGKTGYVTTKSAFVQSVYYQQKLSKITVIAPNGVNAYKNKDLSRQTKHYRQGQTLAVVRKVIHNLTTRYVLKDGHYITANRKLVQSGRVTMPKTIKTKTQVNRYRDVNLKHLLKRYRKGTKLAVKGWDYSRNGTKRYKVANGYVTANAKLVQVIK